MSESVRPIAVPTPGSREDRLDSWKEIAAYLGREVRTVQGWEKTEGLPVHRHRHGRQGSVYAFRSELAIWQQRREDAQAFPQTGKSDGARSGRSALLRWISAAVALAGLAGSVLWIWRHWPRAQSPATLVVLPFVDMSPGHDREYFSDGLTEDIIDALSRVPNLRVVARTSAFAFKGKPRDIREIGRELNVASVLEGSVRTDGDRLKITAQLNRVADGYHVWSRTYNRELRDIFSVQNDISQAIADEFRAGTVPSREPTKDMEALRLYREGRYLFNQHLPPDSYWKAIDRYKQSLARDPKFALAYASMSEAYAYLAENFCVPPGEVMPKAKEAAERALALDPNSAEGHTALGTVKLDYEWRRQDAQDEFRRAMSLEPGSGYIRHWYAHSLESQGKLTEAMKEMRAALSLDPLAVPIHWDIGTELLWAGDNREAVRFMTKSAELFPNHPIVLTVLAWAHYRSGDLSAGHAASEKMRQTAPDIPAIKAFLGRSAALEGDRRTAATVLQDFEQRRKTEYIEPVLTLWIASDLGDQDLIRRWFRRAWEVRSPLFVYLPLEARYRNNPEFKTMLSSIQ